MRKNLIKNTDLQSIGFYDIELIKVAGKTAKKLLNAKRFGKKDLLEILKEILVNPKAFLADPDFSILANKAITLQNRNDILKQENKVYKLRQDIPKYSIFGKENIEEGAIVQMNTAMQLPISVKGALMPDAHHGYGLPIGGVLATEVDKVIPYAVGVDIACRMCMSIFEVEASYLDKNKNKFQNLLLKNTCFGTGKGFDKPMQDDLFDKEAWKATKTIRDLKKKAMAQIGSSGTGNHFVEWGYLEILSEDKDLGLPVGSYVALLSHSGSRGFGASVAGHYTKIAMEKTKLPKQAQHLAWLDLSTEEGQEYWIAMNLAGEYASANHHHIHKKMAISLNTQPLKIVENHHNFAWKETLPSGKEVIVHRKGATPASERELGIIPGSMVHTGYLIKGKGNPKALASAAHGAGRILSRSKAKKTLTQEDLKRVLVEHEVKLVGGDLDEAPMVYKNIDEVMAFQKDLLTVLAKFSPKIVRMADKESPRRRKKKAESVEFRET